MLAEIDDMKKEKSRSVNKIRELLDRLDKSEDIIASLSEDLLAREDRIAMLENHINELEEEVKKLHDCLDEVVNTGEQIKQHSYEKIDQSLKRMEAHHSKATHNMKMELIKLQNKNMKLEEQLSATQLKTEETLIGQNKYISQINYLQNEREIIVDDIRQLELNNVGDSALSPTNCNLSDIRNSLNRISKYIDAKCSKSTSLEQTLLKMQTSSQLLLSKADEAKK
ncbi:uncharacterized protein LOC119192940 [Manduca sexta]|nr:uncharacterized protein LOC119192940 [Manduca sexta]